VRKPQILALPGKLPFDDLNGCGFQVAPVFWMAFAKLLDGMAGLASTGQLITDLNGKIKRWKPR